VWADRVDAAIGIKPGGVLPAGDVVAVVLPIEWFAEYDEIHRAAMRSGHHGYLRRMWAGVDVLFSDQVDKPIACLNPLAEGRHSA
jgi:hypothetical protein